MTRRAAILLSLLAAAAAPAADRDPVNPSCPRQLNWASYPEMQFTLRPKPGGGRILLAEGLVDSGAPERLAVALITNAPVDEIWLRSPGGDASAGNAAGRLIRKAGIPTRIPAGWACFSACNFVFMGGPIRVVEPGGQFVVHMFTFTSDEQVQAALARGKDAAMGAVGQVEQGSALLATDDNDFLIRMGVSRKLLTEVMYTQGAVAEAKSKSTRRCLTQDEVHRYNVANLSE